MALDDDDIVLINWEERKVGGIAFISNENYILPLN